MEKAPPGPLIHIGANGIGIFKVLSNSWSYFYDSIIDDFGLWIDLQGRSKVPPPPLCKPCFKQTNYNMKIWWETSFWHCVTTPLKNPGYAPGFTRKQNNETRFALQVPSMSDFVLVGEGERGRSSRNDSDNGCLRRNCGGDYHTIKMVGVSSAWSWAFSSPQPLRSFWPAAGIDSSGFLQHRKSAIHGLPVKSGKSDWLRIWNEYSAHRTYSNRGSRSLPRELKRRLSAIASSEGEDVRLVSGCKKNFYMYILSLVSQQKVKVKLYAGFHWSISTGSTLGARCFFSFIRVTELSGSPRSREKKTLVDQHYSLWRSSPLANEKTSGIQGTQAQA